MKLFNSLFSLQNFGFVVLFVFISENISGAILANLKKDNDAKTITTPNKSTLVFTNNINSPFYSETRWGVLFQQPRRPAWLCSTKVSPVPLRKKVEEEKDEYLNELLPKSKPNFFKRAKHGEEQSAYLFDWYDAFLRDDVLNEFRNIYKLAKASNPDLKTPNVYNVTNQLEAYKTMGVGNFITLEVKDSEDVKKKLLENLSMINKKLNVAVYEKGITVSQLANVIKLWEWHYDPNLLDWAKHIFDRFDYDGDGRLSVSEFILFSIVYLSKTEQLGSNIGKNTYFNVTAQKIDGLFTFADCNGDGFITAEELWYSSKYIIRDPKMQGRYDIYKCSAYYQMPDNYRSAAANDFILKNSNSVEGMVNMLEFRTGILLGYWNRQVTDLEIIDTDIINDKLMRWGNEGHVDMNCEAIKKVSCVNCSGAENARKK